MSFIKILSIALNVYKKNLQIILPFSIALLISFPLSLLLPNFIASSGIFLRYASIQQDLNLLHIILRVISFLVSIALFSFALVAININSKSTDFVCIVCAFSLSTSRNLFHRVKRDSLWVLLSWLTQLYPVTSPIPDVAASPWLLWFQDGLLPWWSLRHV